MTFQRRGITPGRVWASLIGVAAFVYFVYPLPQIREAEHQRILAEERAAEEKRLMEQRQLYEAKEKAILAASDDAIRNVVLDCQQAITKALTENSPFDVYFPSYSPDQLRKFADIGAAFQTALGSPSAALDNYEFDPVSWNIERVQHKDYPIRTIAFAVEGASDGFSVKRYAAVYSCSMDGLALFKPSRDFIVYTD